MKILPALSVLNENVVEVIDGSYHQIKDSEGNDWLVEDILWNLKDEGYDDVYILDIDGTDARDDANGSWIGFLWYGNQE